jgi:hypothetical protein
MIGTQRAFKRAVRKQSVRTLRPDRKNQLVVKALFSNKAPASVKDDPGAAIRNAARRNGPSQAGNDAIANVVCVYSMQCPCNNFLHEFRKWGCLDSGVFVSPSWLSDQTGICAYIRPREALPPRACIPTESMHNPASIWLLCLLDHIGRAA